MKQSQQREFSLLLSDGRTIVLTTELSLTESDLPGLQSKSPGGPVAAVNPNPTDPDIFGLQNLSQTLWHVRLASGDTVEIKPGKTARLAKGVRIRFGTIEGAVVERAALPAAGRSRVVMRAGLVGVGIVALVLGGWGLQRRYSSEAAHNQQIAREQKLLLEKQRKEKTRREIMELAQREKQEREKAKEDALAEGKRQQQRMEAERKAADEKLKMQAAAARAFDGVWIANGPSLGHHRLETEDEIANQKVVLGSWHVILEISGGNQARLTKEVTQKLGANSIRWSDMESPYDKTRERFLKYVTESNTVGMEDSALSISWSEWELTTWRPEDFPKEVMLNLGAGGGPSGWKMRFQRTSDDEITSADWVFKRVKTSQPNSEDGLDSK